MRGKFLIPFNMIGLIISIISIHNMTKGGSIILGLTMFSTAIIAFGIITSKLIDLNYAPKKPALNYE